MKLEVNLSSIYQTSSLQIGYKSALRLSPHDFAFLLLTLFRQIQYPQGWSMLTISATRKQILDLQVNNVLEIMKKRVQLHNHLETIKDFYNNEPLDFKHYLNQKLCTCLFFCSQQQPLRNFTQKNDFADFIKSH